MLTREQYFPGQSSEEQVALFIRRHWMAFIPWGLAVVLLTIAGFIMSIVLWNISSGAVGLSQIELRVVTIIGTAMYFLSILFGFIRSWMGYYLDVTIVTERRLIDIEQEGVFHRSIAEQSLLRVQDVSARQRGFFEHWFNFGTIYIETAGEQPNFELHNIPRPTEIAKTILNLHERIIHGHGLRVDPELMLPRTPVYTVAQADEEQRTLERPKHPLEELRPYFPEPGRRQIRPVPTPVRPAKPSPNEGQLAEGETIQMHPRN